MDAQFIQRVAERIGLGAVSPEIAHALAPRVDLHLRKLIQVRWSFPPESTVKLMVLNRMGVNIRERAEVQY